jgi:hypothetical protein
MPTVIGNCEKAGLTAAHVKGARMSIGYGRQVPPPTRPVGIEAHHGKIRPSRRRSSTRGLNYEVAATDVIGFMSAVGAAGWGSPPSGACPLDDLPGSSISDGAALGPRRWFRFRRVAATGLDYELEQGHQLSNFIQAALAQRLPDAVVEDG